MGQDRAVRGAQIFIQNGAAINDVDADGNAVIHIAAKNGISALVKHLIEKEASVNLKNSNGDTPLNIKAPDRGLFSGRRGRFKRGNFRETWSNNCHRSYQSRLLSLSWPWIVSVYSHLPLLATILPYSIIINT